jgi:glyoxylase-like metal-dependent hydrolase (beta-lactamase superfamily II)
LSAPHYLFDDVPAPGELRQIAPGVQWLRMPLPMALDHINLYLLEDEDGWWLIDTGIAVGQTQALWEQVFATGLGDKPVKAVLSTHYHPDHIGMAGWLCERWQVPFYMTQAEYLSGLAWLRRRTGRACAHALQRLRRLYQAYAHGLSPAGGWHQPGHQWPALAGGGGAGALP